jgi:hypothetical protein
MLILVRELAVRSDSPRLEFSLDSPPLGCEQFVCSCRVHRQRS